MDAQELKIHRMNTEAFIGYRPTVIALVPVNRTRTASGGYVDAPQAPRSPQTFRLIELTSGTSLPVVRLTDGTQREVQHQLLGLHNSQMAINDQWTDPVTGRHWTIVDIATHNGYEKRGLVVERGK